MTNLCVYLLLVVMGTFGSHCNWRYFKHYEQKACKPVLGSNGCPVKFLCEPLSEEDRRTCVHNGRIYKDKDHIQDLGPCDSCRCEVDRRGYASIECAEVDCPDWEAKNKSCYMGYKPENCCPQEICPGGKESQKTCNHNGKDYKIGKFIESKDPCKSCICTENWSGEEGPGCTTVNCLFGIYAKDIRKGCLPVYSEKSCCPLEVSCDGIFGATPAVINDSKDKDDYCHHQGQYYERGSTAYLKSDTHQCISCQCTTPPEFTCVRKTCPPMPREGCKPVYGKCCPKYECP